MIKLRSIILVAGLAIGAGHLCASSGPCQRNLDFNAHWKFKRCDPTESVVADFSATDFDDAVWEPVTLPHTPRLEPLVVNDQWQGICWYRKTFVVPGDCRGQKIYLEFEAAMQIAEVWVNGKPLTTHYGGYLPFTIDLTEVISFDHPNLIALRLDNRDNPEVPPGKPLKDLDFCMYGGLYRNVRMHVTNKLHLTGAGSANRVASGGIFVQYPLVAVDRAQVRVQAHILNEHAEAKEFKVVSRLVQKGHKLVTESVSPTISLAAAADQEIVLTMNVPKPQLWHPYAPYLYELQVKIVQAGETIDSVATRIGIRRIAFSATQGCRINGEPFYLRGTNYHQEYPYLGYALPDPAHYRDALLIKQAGFDVVRLSHYPHAPAFMDACDELGLLVMDAIPGWQFFGDELFQQRSLQDCRDMIRRDRNHPSVILWEVSLNESAMPPSFMAQAHRIAHEEYPGDQCFTCGWLDDAYEVFIPARQHAHPPDYWSKYDHKPLFIAEYGDWEYYAQDAGFNQPEFKNLLPEERTSRQLRSAGEKRLLQQARNYQEALNDNLHSPAAGCANWLMFDYNRGYATDLEASGIMDIFRLPKFSYYFFKSQRTPEAAQQLVAYAEPMVHIANNWTANSTRQVRVFSNCESVTLYVNGQALAAQGPDHDIFSGKLKFPPFTFTVDHFQPGELRAVGSIQGKPVASHLVRTPRAPRQLRLTAALQGINPAAGQKDVFFIYASSVDEKGTVVPTAMNEVTFVVRGPARLIGQTPIAAEAGIATMLVEISGAAGVVEVEATSPGLSAAEMIKLKID